MPPNALLWLVAAASLIAALMAWRRARATAKRVEQLSQMYWELRYQHGELRAHVHRTAPPDGAPAGRPQESGGAPPPGGFIPLSSLKR